MTSREIAELTGKPHNDVLKAIRAMEPAWENVNGEKFSLVEYTDGKGEKRPQYHHTKIECLYVATKFNDEARARLIIRWEELEMASRAKEPEELLLQSVQLMVEQKKRLNQIEQKVNEIDVRTMTRPDYYTIVGYGTVNGMQITLKQACSLGKKATEICRKKGLFIDRMTDPRFGVVKLYPTKVLDGIFDSKMN